MLLNADIFDRQSLSGNCWNTLFSPGGRQMRHFLSHTGGFYFRFLEHQYLLSNPFMAYSIYMATLVYVTMALMMSAYVETQWKESGHMMLPSLTVGHYTGWKHWSFILDFFVLFTVMFVAFYFKYSTVSNTAQWSFSCLFPWCPDAMRVCRRKILLVFIQSISPYVWRYPNGWYLSVLDCFWLSGPFTGVSVSVNFFLLVTDPSQHFLCVDLHPLDCSCGDVSSF